MMMNQGPPSSFWETAAAIPATRSGARSRLPFQIATAFTTTAYPVFPPQGFTLRWFEKFLATPEFVESMKISAMLATASTCIAAVLGTTSALALARFQEFGYS